MVSVHQPTSESFRSFIQRVRSLKIHSLVHQLDRSEISAHWTEKQTVKTIAQYFAFLYLVNRYPSLPLIPTCDIKQVWYCHSRDAEQYAADCQTLFGNIYPFFDTVSLSKDDRRDPLVASVLTQVLFRKHFGCSMSTTLPALRRSSSIQPSSFQSRSS